MDGTVAAGSDASGVGPIEEEAAGRAQYEPLLLLRDGGGWWLAHLS
jgi:hypothetical protein